MINIPLPKIKEKILSETDISEDALDKKIQEKLEQLSGLISEEGAAHIIANEMGVKLIQTSGKLEITNILAGMRNVEVNGKVTNVYEMRTFDTGERSGKIASFMMADPTGRIRAVLWNDQAELVSKIKQGDVVSIKSAYVRDNNNRLELHLNDSSEVKINPAGIKIDVDVTNFGSAERKKLVELKETDDNVEVLATIVQAFEPRFFEVCPGCGKRLKDADGAYECVTHGKVKTADYAYVMNVFLDDGSDNIRTVLWRRQVQALLDMKDEQVQDYREKPAEFETIKNDLLGNIVKIKGRVNKNEAYDRLELVANFIERNPNPEEEIQKLKAEAEKVVNETTEETVTEDTTTSAEETTEKEEKPTETKVEAKATLKTEVKEEVKEEVKVEDEGFDDVDFDDIDDVPSVDDL